MPAVIPLKVPGKSAEHLSQALPLGCVTATAHTWLLGLTEWLAGGIVWPPSLYICAFATPAWLRSISGCKRLSFCHTS